MIDFAHFDSLVDIALYFDTPAKCKKAIAQSRWTDGDVVCPYIRTFSSYDNLPVTCTVTVEMIPKKDRSSVVSFNFYTPKPYIFPNVYYSASPVERENPDRIVGGLEPIRIDDMSIGSFQSMYGTTFSSICGVYNNDYGYEIFFY